MSIPDDSPDQSKLQPEHCVDPPESSDTTIQSNDPPVNENEITEDLPSLTAEDRTRLFHEAQEFENSGNMSEAIRCYLKCLEHLDVDTAFSNLPNCLRAVAEYYNKREEFEKAVQFVQAEKLFYESALIDNSVIQRKIRESGMEKLGEGLSSGSEISPNAMRAEEYESLSDFCLNNEQHQLALEYAAKAAKLRQEVFGLDHPLTNQSLDFLANVYALVGRSEYSRTLNEYTQRTLTATGRLEANDEDIFSTAPETLVDLESSPSSSKTQSILKLSSASNIEKKKRVRFARSHQITPIEATGSRQPIIRRVSGGGNTSYNNKFGFFNQLLILFMSATFVFCSVIVVSVTACRYIEDPMCRAVDLYVRQFDDWVRLLYIRWISPSVKIVGQ